MEKRRELLVEVKWSQVEPDYYVHALVTKKGERLRRR
jgi:hypothetical protein